MTVFFTADTHFGCDRLVSWTRKEFVDCKQHDEHLMDVLNTVVGPNDRLIILGDFCKEKPGRYRHKIRCKNIMFVLGNHDKEVKIRRVFGGNVRRQYIAKCYAGSRVWCCHFPTCYWDRSHYGLFHAYGHLHDSAAREAQMDLGMPGRRSMDVGVDHAHRVLGDYRPWSEYEFLLHMKDREGHDIIKKEDRWE